AALPPERKRAGRSSAGAPHGRKGQSSEPLHLGKVEGLVIRQQKGPVREPRTALHGAGNAPVDSNVLARDIAASVGGEEGDQLGDLLDRSVTPHRNATLALRRLRKAVDEAREDI